ncbi:MAG: PAS domain-containing protein [Candidatus Hydrogenedentota bacterium]|nr:MAG: PAS domain-containing protein [Candidatus Hydrogenedentota bacterium]
MALKIPRFKLSEKRGPLRLSGELWGLPLFLALFAVTFTLLVFLITIYQSLGADILPIAGVFIFLSAIFWLVDPLLKEKLPQFAANVVLIAVYLIAAQVLLLNSGGVQSPFFLVYYFVVFTAAMSYGLSGAVAVTILIAVAYGTFINHPEDFPRYLISIIVLWIIALMVGFLAETKRRVEAKALQQSLRLAGLEQVARFLRNLTVSEDAVEIGLAAVVDLLEADCARFFRNEDCLMERFRQSEPPSSIPSPCIAAVPVLLGDTPHEVRIYRSEPLSSDEARIVRILFEKVRLVWSSLTDRASLEAMRAEKERILDSIRSAVVALDEEGRVTSANRRAMELLDGGTGRLIGSQASDPPLRILLSVLEENLPREMELETFSGETIPVRLRMFRKESEAGEPAGWILVIEDLRDIRRLEATLRRAESLAAVGELAARVAHEVRNPLGGILGFLGLAKKKASPELQGYLEEAIQAVTRLEKTVQDLLLFSRPIAAQQGSLSLEAVIEYLENQPWNTTAPRVNVTTVLQGTPPAGMFLRGDIGLVEQVFGNMIRNAVEAAQPEGQVVIRILGGDPLFWFEIEDTGPGVPEEIRERIFEPFVSGKESGSGLGLAIVRKILAEIGGTVRYERIGRTPERGKTRFRLGWPVATEGRAGAARPNKTPTKSDENPWKKGK